MSASCDIGQQRIARVDLSIEMASAFGISAVSRESEFWAPADRQL